MVTFSVRLLHSHKYLNGLKVHCNIIVTLHDGHLRRRENLTSHEASQFPAWLVCGKSSGNGYITQTASLVSLLAR
jgi:hypothetical protein